MITEDYVSFETAKLLKEKGFDEICYLGYNKNGEYVPTSNRTNSQIIQPDFCYICCPTLQMAMKWLREVKNILISVNPTLDKDGFVCVMYYIWDIDDIETKATTSGLYSHESYNECIEAALKYCLENLI